jgi:hypothetical protein
MRKPDAINSEKRLVKIPEQVFDVIRYEAKNPGKIVHIIASGNKWAVKMAGASRATKIFPEKKNALHRARKMVKKGSAESIISHARDGSFTIVK